MFYTVKQLADLAEISVRTLHYYDEIGLLSPTFVKSNGYRYYEEKELLKLQQILFFRELDFPIEDIKAILSGKNFNMTEALRDQRKLIELKKKRLDELTKTIDKTIKKINQKIIMDDKDLYGGLSKEEMEAYQKEAKERWGNTESYKQSAERVKKLGKEGMARIGRESEALQKEIAANMDKGPKSPIVQKLIEKHYKNLRNFYEPNLEMYRGLANMYVADVRFAAYYEKFAEGLASFMKEAMLHFADSQENK